MIIYTTFQSILIMKSKTLLSICFLAFWSLAIMRAWGFKPPVPVPPKPATKSCNDIPNVNTVQLLNIKSVELTYEPGRYPFSASDFNFYHSPQPLGLNNIVTPLTEGLGADRRSFLKVYVQGTQCSGVVESNTYQSKQVEIITISGIRAFTQEGGSIKDVKIIANAILSQAWERLVWTKVYSGVYLSQLKNWSGGPDGEVTIQSRAIVQYPMRDSLYLSETSWMNNPIYDDGDYVISGGGTGGGDGGSTGGGGGTVIDPEPYDSLHFH